MREIVYAALFIAAYFSVLYFAIKLCAFNRLEDDLGDDEDDNSQT